MLDYFGQISQQMPIVLSALNEGFMQTLRLFFVTLLDHSYWFLGATLGGLFGSLIAFSTEGIDFVMTAMFVVIFLEKRCTKLKLPQENILQIPSTQNIVFNWLIRQLV